MPKRSWDEYVGKAVTKIQTGNPKPKKPLAKKTVKAGHKLGKRLEKYEDHIKTPYGLGMYMAKKGIKPLTKSSSVTNSG